MKISNSVKDKNFEMINGIFSFNGGGPTKKNSHLRRYFFLVMRSSKSITVKLVFIDDSRG